MRFTKTLALLAGAITCGVIAPVATAGSKPAVKKVTVADDYFAPTKLTVKKGGAVNFVWSSANFDTHNVTLIKGPKGVSKSKFTSIDGTSGLHFKRTFTATGTYHFECTIHPGMNIVVTVKK